MEIFHYKKNDICMDILPIHNEPIDEVSYVLYCDAFPDCLIIDPSGISGLRHVLQRIRKEPSWILLTHEHCDHIDAVNDLTEEYKDCRILCSFKCGERIVAPRKNLSQYYELLIAGHTPKDYQAPEPFGTKEADVVFDGSYLFQWHGLSLSLTETPGHSPGSICIEMEDVLFSGDSLLRDFPVVTRLPGGDREAYAKVTGPFLKQHDDNCIIFPGHGEKFHLGESRFLPDMITGKLR